MGSPPPLSVSSTAPTWRDASVALVLLTGLYLVLAAIASYGFGGYLAGRLRPAITDGTSEETEFRDGAHGLLVWAIATVLTALLALAALPTVTRFRRFSRAGNLRGRCKHHRVRSRPVVTGRTQSRR